MRLSGNHADAATHGCGCCEAAASATTTTTTLQQLQLKNVNESCFPQLYNDEKRTRNNCDQLHCVHIEMFVGISIRQVHVVLDTEKCSRYARERNTAS
jgi:hypothetical protein